MHPNTLMSGPDDVHMRYTKFYMMMFSFVPASDQEPSAGRMELQASGGPG